MKRKGYFDWDETFMLMCNLIAQRSKDPTTQVGACIVSDKNIIISFGYNGFPRGCSDDELPWGVRKGKFADTKYPYIVHAEANAVLNAHHTTEDAKIYCNLFPCNECAKIIIQKGIKEVIFDNEYDHTEEADVAHRLFDLAGVKCRKYTPRHNLKFINN
jgi:dCMP deaminase